jgi:hypothetical protein
MLQGRRVDYPVLRYLAIGLGGTGTPRGAAVADVAGVLLRSVTAAAMAAVEGAAGQLGHGVGSWYGQEECIWLTSCTRCQRLGWVVRSGFEPWRMGGPIREEPCEEK